MCAGSCTWSDKHSRLMGSQAWKHSPAYMNCFLTVHISCACVAPKTCAAEKCLLSSAVLLVCNLSQQCALWCREPLPWNNESG